MSLEQIHEAIPHRYPFLMVDRIVESSPQRVVCTKSFTGEEDFFGGHFPEFPVVPGVLLCEAAMQAGAILLSSGGDFGEGKVPVVTRMSDVRFKRMVRPGDTIQIEADLKEQLSGVYFLIGKVTVEGKLAARLEFACTAAAIQP